MKVDYAAGSDHIITGLENQRVVVGSICDWLAGYWAPRDVALPPGGAAGERGGKQGKLVDGDR